jgi:hypothetical protein
MKNDLKISMENGNENRCFLMIYGMDASDII